MVTSLNQATASAPDGPTSAIDKILLQNTWLSKTQYSQLKFNWRIILNRNELLLSPSTQIEGCFGCLGICYISKKLTAVRERDDFTFNHITRSSRFV